MTARVPTSTSYKVFSLRKYYIDSFFSSLVSDQPTLYVVAFQMHLLFAAVTAGLLVFEQVSTIIDASHAMPRATCPQLQRLILMPKKFT